MVAHRRVTHAMVHGVADQAAPTRIGAVEPDLQLVVAQVPVEVEIADPRLDEGVGAGLVDLQHAVHALEVEHHGAGETRRGAAVGKVAPRRNGPERDLELVGDGDDALHLLDRVRRQGPGGDVFERLFTFERAVGVAVGVDVLVAGQHPVRAEDLFPFALGRREGFRGDPRRQFHSSALCRPPFDRAALRCLAPIARGSRHLTWPRRGASTLLR